jgi:hypothetical protein
VNKDKNDNYNLEIIGVEVSKISPKYWATTIEVKTSEGHILVGHLLIVVD